jgi:hypothetical protein
VIARLNHFTRSHTSVLTLSLPLIGLMIGGVLSELIVFHINKARLVRVRTHKCAGANDLPESALPRKRPSATATQHVVMGQFRTHAPQQIAEIGMATSRCLTRRRRLAVAVHQPEKLTVIRPSRLSGLFL